MRWMRAEASDSDVLATRVFARPARRWVGGTKEVATTSMHGLRARTPATTPISSGHAAVSPWQYSGLSQLPVDARHSWFESESTVNGTNWHESVQHACWTGEHTAPDLSMHVA